MTQQENIQKSATVIVDNIIDLQLALAGQTSLHAMRLMRNIQDQARGMISGSAQPEAVSPDGPVSQSYRLDIFEAVQGLVDHLISKVKDEDCQLQGGLSDEDFHVIALAAETASARINNYLMVKRAEAKVLNSLQASANGKEEVANG